jgi:prepilin-type N-terminal cleavage/methylation domain-containing protein
MMRLMIGHVSLGRAAPSGRADRGFSLIEIAVVLFIIVLVIGSALVPLSTQVEQRQVSDTEKSLAEIRDALLGFAVANGYLPCPDTGATGSETVTAGTGLCTTISSGIACGRLPHVNLGVSNSDLWGNRLTYCINEQFARRSPASTFSLTTAGNDVYICATQSCTTTVSTSAVFAVVSHGANEYGATKLSTGAQNTAAPHADEQENYDSDRNIVWRIRTASGATAGEFDDIVVWLPRYTLFNRMVAASKLP